MSKWLDPLSQVCVFIFLCYLFSLEHDENELSFYKVFEETPGKNIFCINEMVIIIKLELNQRSVKEI